MNIIQEVNPLHRYIYTDKTTQIQHTYNKKTLQANNNRRIHQLRDRALYMTATIVTQFNQQVKLLISYSEN